MKFIEHETVLEYEKAIRNIFKPGDSFELVEA